MKRIVVIDDVGSLLDTARKELEKRASVFEVLKFHYDLKRVYDTWLASGNKKELPSRKTLDAELLAFLKEVRPDFILMDWGYSVIVPSETPINPTWFSLNTPQAVELKCSAPDLIFGRDGASDIIPVGSYLKSLEIASRPDLLIYTYNPFNPGIFEELTKVQDRFALEFGSGNKNLSKAPSLHYIETSAFFNHPQAQAIYKGWHSQKIEDDLREIGTEQQLEQYGTFLSEVFNDYINERNTRNNDVDTTRIFDIENLRFVRYKRIVSDKLGHVSFGGNQAERRTIHLKFGALTYYYGEGRPLMDIPRKDYYPALDDFASKVGLSKILNALELGTPFWDDKAKNFLYVRLFPRQSIIPERALSGLLDIAIEAWHSNMNFNDEQLRKLVSLLYSSVFYHCDKDMDVWRPSFDWVYMSQGIDLRTWRQHECIGTNKLSPIDLFYFCQNVETDGGQPGWINYTLYCEDQITAPLSIKHIEEIRDRVLFDIRPAVIAKAKDALLPRLFGEVKSKSRAAAISQVLARTLSHNLGSHSLNAFSGGSAMLGHFQELECRKRHLFPMPGRVLANDASKESGEVQLPPGKSCIDECGKYESCNPQEEARISEQRREWLGIYNNYLRERMDLLADITTAVPAFEMPKLLVADLLEGYARNVLLATTIAGTGGHFRYCWQPAGLIADGKDVNVAIPSDVLGNHAFYLILENIVRNSAKHGGHSEEVVFTVKVEEPEDKWKKQGLLKVQITENRTKLEGKNLVAARNASINAPVLDEKTRRVRDNGWGTLEMKAACAYLRRIALEELDEKKYLVPTSPKEEAEQAKNEPPLLKAIGNGGAENKQDFGYEFYLMQPKLVMVCANKETDEAVITSAALNNEGTGSVQDHSIGAMTLADLEAITEGERKEVVNHALLVYLAQSEVDLKRFIHAALADLAALPHEMVVVGREGIDASAFEKLLIQAKDSLLAEAKYGKISPAAIVHNASILERSVVWMEWTEWEKVVKVPKELYMEVRHRWLVGWMNRMKYGLNSVPEVYRTYLNGRLKPELIEPSVLLYADYDAHNEMNKTVIAFLKLKGNGDSTLPNDLSSFIRIRRDSGHRPIIQRYPDALSRVMTLGWKTSGEDKNQYESTITDEDKMIWAQHHLTSWTQGVVVIDERVQAVAENETYQPAASEKNKDPKPIRVKDLLSMGGVFVPPGFNLQRPEGFSGELWVELVHWLEPLHPMLGYVCVHLTILEKFSKQMNRTVENLIQEVKCKLPGIRIIVVSGRGKPPELPKSELFMSYSALAQYTTQTYQRAPVLLNILAHSTRRIIAN